MCYAYLHFIGIICSKFYLNDLKTVEAIRDTNIPLTTITLYNEYTPYPHGVAGNKASYKQVKVTRDNNSVINGNRVVVILHCTFCHYLFVGPFPFYKVLLDLLVFKVCVEHETITKDFVNYKYTMI